MPKKRNFLILTYFSNFEGNSPAEWANDKIDALLKLNHKITLITSILSKSQSSKNLNIIKIPSLSLNDFRFEVSENKRLNNPTSLNSYFFFIAFFPIGMLVDLLQILLLKNIGEGRWSWCLSNLIIAPFLIFKNFEYIFSTGGPACSHISAVILSKLFFVKCICELQDPLVGRDIGRQYSSKFLELVEKLLVKHCSKLVFVTETAKREAINRYKKNNIKCVYPGAKKIINNKIFRTKKIIQKKIKIAHIGTLYTNRNLNNLIKAVDELIFEKKIEEDTFEITNIGEIYGKIKKNHLMKSYIKQLPITNRLSALKQSTNYEYLMIVQHTDERSKTTIPFKFYDYLNLNKLIIGIINSNELKNIFAKNGFLHANANSVYSIKKMLMNLKKTSKRIYFPKKKLELNYIEQTKKIFDE